MFYEAAGNARSDDKMDDSMKWDAKLGFEHLTKIIKVSRFPGARAFQGAYPTNWHSSQQL